jgi:hypothetical protein
MCVYFFSALLKTSPVYLPEGTAIYYTLQLDTFATPIGHWLANFPTIMHWLTYYVWWLELLGPFLMFVPLFFLTFRLFTQASLILMHMGFLLCLTIGLFPLISIVSLLIFTPGAVWDWLERRTNRGDSDLIQVFYDGHCDFCRKTNLAQGKEPACVASCPTRALVFGNLDDPDSPIAKRLVKETTYRYKQALGTSPKMYRVPKGEIKS